MKPITALLTLAVTASFAADPAGITYDGKDGPGKEKRIVLLAGDEEYRSEEALPQLAKILSQRHGFTCAVLFSIDPETGEIDPKTQNNEPGLEALDSADLCIMSLRYRAWPDGQMKHFADYTAAGKPFIALRTSTHAFNGIKGAYAKFNRFGKDVLGEQWVSHWGRHKSEATRGVIEEGAKDNPLLNGVSDIFGTTDVYEAAPPGDATILVRGQVLKGMTPDSEPADYEKKRAGGGSQGVNDPMMPVVWTRDRSNRILCTTLGAATDLENEGLRRLIVNAAYQFTGLEVPANADVRIVGEYKPTQYGFDGFVKGVKPADYATE